MVGHPIPHESRGREYLANERTFLAWIRTSIAVISLGFVVARFSLWMRELSGRARVPSSAVHGISIPMGESLMLFGGVLAVLAGWRYHVVNRSIVENRVKADRWLVVLVTISVVLLAIVMAVAMYLSDSGG